MSRRSSPEPTELIEPQSARFDRWAEVYDTQRNPLVALEARSAAALLPRIAGMDVLDVGCGTGRWLERLEAEFAHSLTGTDPSPAMLERAARKLAATTVLEPGDGSSFPSASSSCDLIIASFVLSYVPDLSAFVSECARVLRRGGHVFLTDMHPVTAAQRGWDRGFTVEGTTTQLNAECRSLDEIGAMFEAQGFSLEILAEPSFGSPERSIFLEAGKLAEYTRLMDVPAIYLARFRRRGRSPLRRSLREAPAFRLVNARWSSQPAMWNDSSLAVRDGLIGRHDESPGREAAALDLCGYVVLPGLINAHDHLEFALFPNLGRSRELPAYRNSTEWATEIHREHAATIATHRQVPLGTRLWWGAIRNLLSGVTTVCHHNPMHRELARPDFPVRVVSGIGWSHSLPFDRDIERRFRETPGDQPFVLHVAEGTDERSRAELGELDRLGMVGRRTVMVHGLAFTPEDVALLNQRGASIVLCPTSNVFLFGRALPKALVSSLERCALGSDSPLTGAGDLLDEICYLQTELGIDEEMIYRFVTIDPAAILQLRRGEGRIAAGGPADLIAVRESLVSPAGTLARLSLADIELVMLGGRVQVVSPSLYERLPEPFRAGLALLEIAGQRRWVRAPLQRLFQSAEEVLGKGNIRLGGKEVRYHPAV